MIIIRLNGFNYMCDYNISFFICVDFHLNEYCIFLFLKYCGFISIGRHQ